MKMKDSGVEWIGEIPEDWDIGKVNRALKHVKEVAGDKHGLYPRLSLAKSGVIERPKYDGNGQAPADYNTYQIVPKQQFVFNLMGLEQDSDYRRVGVPEKSGLLSSGYVRMDNNSDVLNVKYGYYYFLTLESYRIFNAYGTGIRSTLNGKQLEKLPLILPAIDEQQKIADFLDSKIALIDQIIADTKRSIEELKAYKQSLITETVTKGLDPNVPMKDSGVEWIGEIARTVKIIKLKFLLNSALTYGANEAGIEYSERLPRYIRITDIDLDGKLKNSGKLSLSDEVAKPYLLEEGDLLFARSGATVGKTFVYHDYYGKSAYAGYLIKASLNKKSVLPEYLYYYTQSSLYESWKSQIFIQSTIQNIGADKYNVLPVVLQESIDIQRQIVDFLDEKSNQIDKLILDKQRLIQENESYKKSLIYEYVTGKKRVYQ